MKITDEALTKASKVCKLIVFWSAAALFVICGIEAILTS